MYRLILMALLIPCLLFAGGTQIWAPFFTVGGVLKADSLAIRALTVNSAYSFPDAIGSNNTFLGVNGSGVFGFHSPSFSGAGGWTDYGSVVELTTSSDNVGIGGVAHGSTKLSVYGGINIGLSDAYLAGSVNLIKYGGSNNEIIIGSTNVSGVSRSLVAGRGCANVATGVESSFLMGWFLGASSLDTVNYSVGIGRGIWEYAGGKVTHTIAIGPNAARSSHSDSSIFLGNGAGYSESNNGQLVLSNNNTETRT